MRSLRFSFLALALAVAVPSIAPAQPTEPDSVISVSPQQTGAPDPADQPSFPIEFVGLAALATAKKAAKKGSGRKSQAAQAAKAARQREDLVRAQAVEVEQLAIRHADAAAAVNPDATADFKRTLSEQQAAERAALKDSHARALTALDTPDE